MVTIYSKDYCPYCKRAKDLLNSLNIQYTDIDVTHDEAKFQEAKAKSGIMTVPQIFVNGRFIGGSDDLHALHSEGKLMDILNG